MDALRAVLHNTGGLLALLGRTLRGQVVKRVGGPARYQVIIVFAAVLGLSSADASTVGAVSPQLEEALHISNAEIGLLSSVALLTGAVFVLPVGLLVDRIRRIPLLATTVVIWSAASLASAFAPDYSTLLITRLALGAVTAAAGPAIASLTGDYFPASERGRVYAYILAGESAGTAVGFVISGTLASAISWRAAFIALAIPGFFLARTLWRTIPEPLRGGQSRLAPGVESLDQAVAVSEVRADHRPPEPDQTSESGGGELAQEAASRRGVQPDPHLVLDEDPQQMGLVRSTKYIFSVPTNLVLILSQALGYFYLAGLSTFALLFARGHYHISQITAELMLLLLVIGGILGTLAGGRLTDALLRRGMLEARIWVPALCYVFAAVLLVPGFVGSGVTPAIWFDIAGAALIAAANPPLDAARLDVMPAGLWGRAQSARALLSSLAQALAPLLFGGLSSLIAGFVPAQTPVGTHVHGAISSSTATGLEITFLIMLGTLAAGGLFLATARHTYPRDVATAGASRQARRRREAPTEIQPLHPAGGREA